MVAPNGCHRESPERVMLLQWRNNSTWRKVCCVTATTGNATDAAPIRLRFDVIDQRAAELGIGTRRALAKLLDLDPASVWRFRKGRMAPSLDTAMRVAERLDLRIEDVVERSGGAQ